MSESTNEMVLSQLGNDFSAVGILEVVYIFAYFMVIADNELGQLSVVWQKSFKDSDRIQRSDGHDTVALSAFMLSSLPTAASRKAVVKEMWESGAQIMVTFSRLLDVHNTDNFRRFSSTITRRPVLSRLLRLGNIY